MLGMILSMAALGYQGLRSARPVGDGPAPQPVLSSPASLPASPSPLTPTPPTPTATEPSQAATPRSTVTSPPPPPAGTPAGRASSRRVESVELPVVGYHVEARTMEIADSGVIDPPDFTHVWWVRDRGVAPGRDATDTAYLACHTHSRRTAAEVPCNVIAPERIPAGSPLYVTTDVEKLTYTVTSVRLVDKDRFAFDDEVWGIHPGRLVWVTCYLEDGRLSDYNTVIIAEIAS